MRGLGAYSIILTFSAASALAGQTAVATGPYQQALKKAVDEKECSYGCLHEQAKNLLSVEEVYLSDQAKKISRSTSALPSSLKSVCAAGESDKDCRKNYLNVVQNRLNHNRVEVGALQDGAARLSVDYARKTGQSVGADQGVRIFKSGEAHPRQEILTAAVPSAAEMLSAATISGVSQLRSNSGLQEMSRAAPRPEDFPLFKEVLRNPDHPEHGMITVVDRNPDGSAKADPQAYAEAVADYQAMIQGLQATSGGLAQTRQVAGIQSASAMVNSAIPNPNGGTNPTGTTPGANASAASGSAPPSSAAHQAIADQYHVEVTEIDGFESARGQFLQAAEKGMNRGTGSRFSPTGLPTQANTMDVNDQKQQQLLNSKLSTPVHLPDPTIRRDLTSVRQIQRM